MGKILPLIPNVYYDYGWEKSLHELFPKRESKFGLCLVLVRKMIFLYLQKEVLYI
jgi:hypothetical protein